MQCRGILVIGMSGKVVLRVWRCLVRWWVFRYLELVMYELDFGNGIFWFGILYCFCFDLETLEGRVLA